MLSITFSSVKRLGFPVQPSTGPFPLIARGVNIRKASTFSGSFQIRYTAVANGASVTFLNRFAAP